MLAAMFERFNNRARHVIVAAQEEARRLHHNYIGTEHLLLGLFSEPAGLGCRVLHGFGMSKDGIRQEVTSIVGAGEAELSGHIPFTPRAKKCLELALREALQLHHDYIGTEHLLLALIREGDGVAARILKEHGGLAAIRTAVLDWLPAAEGASTGTRRWLRRRVLDDSGGPAETATLSATAAADATLSEAARLAGAQPVGSHHLMLAALTDPDSAAARALTALGVDLDGAREALRGVDVAGTSDDQPEEVGRRQMLLRVGDKLLTVEASDPATVAAGRAALEALGERAGPEGAIDGGLAECASLAAVWQALQDSLGRIRERAAVGDLGEQIAAVRREKDAALEAQDFQKAAALRDRERRLIEQRDERAPGRNAGEVA